ncbi:hypothetical protein J2N86_15530 (plasmid) [Legionella lytica]|uniref:Uncharacterized protein n=1 Tax=Legionella lytica TaxID=96232 RepID=A0ABY4YD46_9GAMM|nr:hypothetical protein [Legionella lytica]USQ15558.1 hypothetical protein J2N86_15530 [Legionella lytica]
MNLEDKKNLIHEVTNSFVIIRSISKSAFNFVDKSFDSSITESQIDLFKKAMTSLQKEISKIEVIFQERLSKL